LRRRQQFAGSLSGQQTRRQSYTIQHSKKRVVHKKVVDQPGVIEQAYRRAFTFHRRVIIEQRFRQHTQEVLVVNHFDAAYHALRHRQTRRIGQLRARRRFIRK
jgi:hypothetical protein